MTRAWHQSGLAQPDANARDAVLLGMAWAVLLVAILAQSPALGAVSALVMATAILDARGGWPLVKRYAPALRSCVWPFPYHKVFYRD